MNKDILKINIVDEFARHMRLTRQINKVLSQVDNSSKYTPPLSSLSSLLFIFKFMMN